MNSNINDNIDFGYSRRSESNKYWCHLCKKEFLKVREENAEVNCIYCGKSFCEELDTDSTVNDNDQPNNFIPYENPNRNNNQIPIRTNQEGGGSSSGIINLFNNLGSNNRRLLGGASSSLLLNTLLFSGSGLSGLRGGNVIIRSSSNTGNGNTTGGLSDILSTMGMLGGSGLSGLGSSNDDGFESILNYLMANDPNKHGNPPASKDEVEKLEKILITKEDIDEMKKKNICECSVCKDEFELNQELKKLPCSHLFHVDCLIPWLKQRNSCPTCRFELPTDDADYEKRRKKTI